MTPYLRFAAEAAEAVLLHQSVRPHGSPSEPLFVTATPHYAPAWRSVGKRPGGGYENIPVPAVPLDDKPVMIDFDAWDWLGALGDAAGEPRYGRVVEAMAARFVEAGFDARTGLGYIGAAAQFDASRLGLVPIRGYDQPMFKPAPLPLERLWAASPERVARMFKAAYYGLVTRPADMAYNRYCHYDFDDTARKPSMPFRPNHIAFGSTAAWLIEWWGFHFAQTGDTESLAWAQAMADKWAAAQDPRTGLIPHWFGRPDGGGVQPPRPFCHMRDCATAMNFLGAAAILRRRAGGGALAEQVERIGRRLIHGLAQYAYDEKRRIFPHWLRLTDGAPDPGVVYYHFPTQADKDEAMKVDPTLAEVAVFIGQGFYAAEPSSHACDAPLPEMVARAARLTGDAALIERSRFFADLIAEEASRLDGPLNAEGKWTFPATASFIRQALALAEATGERRYVDQARRLADMEIGFFSRPRPEGTPEWWRLPYRGGLIAAMIELDRVVAKAE